MGNLVDFTSFGLKHAEDSLIEKLVSYGARPELGDDLDRAAEVYWRFHERPGLLTWDDSEGPVWHEDADVDELDVLSARFHDWFLFDYRLQGGLRVIESFRIGCFEHLNRYELQLLSHWVESYYGVFWVHPREDALLLEDVLDGRPFSVAPDAEELATEGAIIAGRPLSLGDVARLSGAVLSVASTMAPSVTSELVRKYETLRGISPDLTVPQFYRLCGHMLDSLLGDDTP